MAAEWSPSSWRNFPVKQQVDYEDADKLAAALERVSSLPPLVYAGEIESLKKQIGDVQENKSFILHGGDCAERFMDCRAEPIENKMKILLQMSLVVTWGALTPVVRIGRIAGQYAKPRSKPKEMVDGVEVYSFKGENINGFEPSDRVPNPDRLVEAYFHSAATLNYVRALAHGGFADLEHTDYWNLDFVKEDGHRAEYAGYVDGIKEAITFTKLAGGPDSSAFRTVDMHTSHEGMLLAYEEALTRKIGGKYYNVGCHFLWIGDRTRDLDGAHIEYFRGIANPIGIKCGPTMQPDDLVALIKALNPTDEAGRITLITRMGNDKVSTLLPPLIEAVQEAGVRVAWVCDPCHGNTTTTEDGIKTRDFANILGEVQQSFQIHRQYEQRLGGVHFELTGDDVTECTGGSVGLSATDLATNYQSYCDPRLNYTQSLEMAFLMCRYLRAQRRTTLSTELDLLAQDNDRSTPVMA